MQSTSTFIKRKLLQFIVSLVLLLLINLLAFTIIGYQSVKRNTGLVKPKDIANNLINDINNSKEEININDTALHTLKDNHIWVMLIDKQFGDITWNIDLPSEIPHSFSRSDIALFTRYYLKDYPVFTYVTKKGVLVLGFPKDSYAKYPANYYDIKGMELLPKYIVLYILLNVGILFAFYWFSKRKLLKDILPITKGICDLPNGKEIKLETNGELSYIQIALNDTSEKLKAQDSMRANWIAGVSHDIRTPLSLVLGYADQLSKSSTLNEEEKKSLQKIISSSETIRSLIEDLNLTSRLEYNLTKIDNEPIDMVKLLRNIIVGFINQGDYRKHTFDFYVEPNNKFILKSNAGLLERAFRNLILNSIKHNPNGCDIYIHVVSYAKGMVITIKDNGKGCSKDKINLLNKPTQLQIEKRKNQDSFHGLGLLIVKQVVELHNGEVIFHSGETKGFQTEIHFPIQKLN